MKTVFEVTVYHKVGAREITTDMILNALVPTIEEIATATAKVISEEVRDED